MLSDLHIAAPWWFLLPVIGLALFALPVERGLPGAWPSLVRPSLHHFATRWLVGNDSRSSRLAYWLIGLLIATGLAGLRIGHIEANPVRNLHARFLVIDVGQPAQVQQLTFIARELASRAVDIPTGVVAVAGDAYDVVPVTSDVSQLDRYLKVLDSALMPVAGREPWLGLSRADAALRRAGITAGQIILLSAGDAPAVPESAPGRASYPAWIVVAGPQGQGWERYADNLNADLVNDEQLSRLDGAISRQRDSAVLEATPVRERRSIAPWLALACLPVWLMVFFRSYKR